MATVTVKDTLTGRKVKVSESAWKTTLSKQKRYKLIADEVGEVEISREAPVITEKKKANPEPAAAAVSDPEPAPADAPATKPLSEMNLPELKAKAAELGLEVKSTSKKPYIDAITKAMEVANG